MTEIQKKLIKNGVANLKEFGYAHATEENILTDEVYSMFFKSMLNDNLGYRDDLDIEINNLLEQLA